MGFVCWIRYLELARKVAVQKCQKSWACKVAVEDFDCIEDKHDVVTISLRWEQVSHAHSLCFPPTHKEAEGCSFQGDRCVCPTGNLEACQWLLALLFLDRDRAPRLRSQKWAAGYRTSFRLLVMS